MGFDLSAWNKIFFFFFKLAAFSFRLGRGASRGCRCFVSLASDVVINRGTYLARKGTELLTESLCIPFTFPPQNALVRGAAKYLFFFFFGASQFWSFREMQTTLVRKSVFSNIFFVLKCWPAKAVATEATALAAFLLAAEAASVRPALAASMLKPVAASMLTPVGAPVLTALAAYMLKPVAVSMLTPVAASVLTALAVAMITLTSCICLLLWFCHS